MNNPLNRAQKIEEQQRKAAAENFGNTAPLKQSLAETPTAEELSAPAVDQPKNSPWRDGTGLTAEQLNTMDRGVSGTMSMELHARLAFIKNRMNGESISKGRRERVSASQLQAQAVEEYTTRILKKWGYDV